MIDVKKCKNPIYIVNWVEKLKVIFAYLSPDQAQDVLEDYHINFVNEKGEDIEF